jgi:hypothetical protein
MLPKSPYECAKGSVIALVPTRVSLWWLSLIAVPFVVIINMVSAFVF